MAEYDGELWSKLMQAGRKTEKGLAHKMTEQQILNIHDWIDYIGAPAGVEDPLALNQMMNYDLNMAKYKLYDLTGMIMQGRWGDELNELGNKIAKAYLVCVDKEIPQIKKFYDCVNTEIFKIK